MREITQFNQFLCDLGLIERLSDEYFFLYGALSRKLTGNRI